MSRFTASIRLYRLLLWLYPARFRQDYGEELARVFEDILITEHTTSKRLLFTKFWLHSAFDLIKTAFYERSHTMREQKPNLALILGGIAILPSILFFTIMMLKFGLGVDNFVYDSWNEHWGNPDNRPFIANIADFFVIMGPVFAFMLVALPLVRINVQNENGTLVGTVRLKLNPVSLTVIGVSVFVGCAFMLYFVAENLAWAAH